MSRTTFDPISVVEAAYAIDRSLDAWLAAVSEAAAPFFSGRSRMMSLIVEADATPHVRELYTEGADARERVHLKQIFDSIDELPDEWSAVYRRRGTGLTSLGQILGGTPSEDPEFSRIGPDDVRDYLGVMAHMPNGDAIQIGAVMASVTEVDEDWKPVWDQITAHLNHAFRLRETHESVDPESADAVVDPGGAVHHARSEHAKQGDIRESLRQAVLRMDDARTHVRTHEPRRALELWQGLVRGHYSLVDFIDTDGQRFYLAQRNEPQLDEPEGLSLRERQVVALASLGYTNQLTAYALGLSPSTVATYMHRARQKLGVKSRIELIRLFRGLIGTD